MTTPTHTELIGLPFDDIKRALAKLDAMASIIAGFAPDYDTTVQSTRTFGYRGARYLTDAGTWAFVADGTIVCTDDATRFVQWDIANGVTLETAVNPLRFLIASVTCASGSITAIRDLRDANIHTPNRMRWRGVWAAGTYLRNDVVRHVNDVWIATATTTDTPGPGTDWEIVVYGVPDPSTADDDDALLVYDGELFYGPVTGGGGGGGSLDVYDEGVLEESGVTTIDFVGAGVVAVGDGSGGVVVTVSGGGGGGGGAPTSPISGMEMHFQADTLGLSAGDNLTGWQDDSGNSKDLSIRGTAPIFRIDSDGLPYVEFVEVGSLFRAPMTAYTGTDITIFMVYRTFSFAAASSANGFGVFSLGNSAETDGNSSATLGIHRAGTFGEFNLRRFAGNATLGPPGLAGTPTLGATEGHFGVVAFRYDNAVSTRAFFDWWINGFHYGQDRAAAGAMGAFNYDGICLAGRWGNGTNFPGGTPTPTSLMIMDWRECLVYHGALHNGEIRHNLRYLGEKWLIPGLI